MAMAVKMNRLMGGRFTSKRYAYAPPPPDQIAPNPASITGRISIQR